MRSTNSFSPATATKLEAREQIVRALLREHLGAGFKSALAALPHPLIDVIADYSRGELTAASCFSYRAVVLAFCTQSYDGGSRLLLLASSGLWRGSQIPPAATWDLTRPTLSSKAILRLRMAATPGG